MAKITITIPNKNLAQVANGLGVGNTGDDQATIANHFAKLAYNAGAARVTQEKEAQLKAVIDSELGPNDITVG